MSAVPSTMTAAAPAVTAQDPELELETAELLPARETLWACTLSPRYYPGGPICYPGGCPGGPIRA